MGRSDCSIAQGTSLFIFAAIVMAGQASAQTTPKSTTITASAEVLYDSNVARTSAERATTSDLKRADTRFRPRIDIALAKTLGPADVTLVGLVGYDFYARNTRLNRERIGLDGAALFEVSRCRLNFTSGIVRGQSNLGDIAILPGSPRANVKNVETIFNYGAEAVCGAKIGLQPLVSVKRETGTNTANIRQYSDYNRIDYTAGLRYVQPVLGEISLLGSIQDVNYPNRPRIANQDDGYSSRSAGVRFKREIGANLQGSVQVNYTDLDPRRPDVEGFSGITWNAQLVATFADRLQLTGTVSRLTLPTLQSDGAYRVEKLNDLAVTYAFTERLSLGASAGFRKMRYPGAGLLGGPALTRDSRELYSGNIGYRASDRLRFTLTGVYETRSANDTLYDYDNSGARFQASLKI